MEGSGQRLAWFIERGGIMPALKVPTPQVVYTKKDIYEFLKNGEKLAEGVFSGSHLIGLYLPKLNLTNAVFDEVDLRYANLAGTILEGASFKGADLTGAKFKGANLFGVNFDEAQLENSDFSRAYLAQTSFKGAKMMYASLDASDISGADFTNAAMRWVNLCGVKGASTAKFHNADLRGARGDYTGLDDQDLKRVGAKTDGMRGIANCVFNFFQVEENGPGLLQRMFASLRKQLK
jgi:uncharacterized protein YjbI with pentapeptide repeats